MLNMVARLLYVIHTRAVKLFYSGKLSESLTVIEPATF